MDEKKFAFNKKSEFKYKDETEKQFLGIFGLHRIRTQKTVSIVF